MIGTNRACRRTVWGCVSVNLHWIRRCIEGSRPSNGYPGPTHLVPLALAERIC